MVETRDGRHRIVARWRGFPYICVTVGSKKEDAQAYHRTLEDLRDAGRRDIVQAIANGDVDLQTVHRKVQTDGARNLSLEALGIGVKPEPKIGELYDSWMAWLRQQGNVSPRTHRPYAPRTIRRYAETWDGLFLSLKGRDHPISYLTTKRLELFVKERVEGGASSATINRDYTAVQSFCRWLADNREEVEFTPPRIRKRDEPNYDEQVRHLEPAELRTIRKHCLPEWWILFEMLYLTGLRIGEAQSMRRMDVDFATGVLNVCDTPTYRLKSRTSNRYVPIAPRLVPILHRFLERPGNPYDFLLPDALRHYDDAYHVFELACLKAGLHDHGAADLTRRNARLAALREDIEARKGKRQLTNDLDKLVKRLEGKRLQLKATRSLHSLRHTFGVACARAGLHLTVIKALMGHSTVKVTERYVKFVNRAEEGQRQARAVQAALGLAKGHGDLEGIRRTPNLPQTARKRRAQQLIPARK